MPRRKDEITGLEYGLGWSSFIPVLGMFLGIGAIVAGANKLKVGGSKLIALALLGILLGTVGSVVLVQKVILHGFTSSAFGKDIYQTMSKGYLKETVMALEYYKVVHQSYPKSLDELKGDGIHFLHDTSAGTNLSTIQKQHAYTLQPDGLHYQLMDTGPDGVTGTADDVAPVMSPEELEHTGYVKP